MRYWQFDLVVVGKEAYVPSYRSNHAMCFGWLGRSSAHGDSGCVSGWRRHKRCDNPRWQGCQMGKVPDRSPLSVMEWGYSPDQRTLGAWLELSLLLLLVALGALSVRYALAEV